MAKKRTTLDALFETIETEVENKREVESIKTSKQVKKNIIKTNSNEEKSTAIVKQTVYLPSQVHDQLRLLAFEERKKMHDYLVEGLDRVFKNRGLKSYTELTKL